MTEQPADPSPRPERAGSAASSRVTRTPSALTRLSRVTGGGSFGPIVLAVASGCLVGIVGTTLVTPSPAQSAAERAIPNLPPVTAPVELKTVADVAQGSCQAKQQGIDVLPPPAGEGERAIVTAVGVKEGDPVKTGTLLASVSGRPLVAVVAPYPFYRDLHPGDVGPDVANLERALVDAGLLDSADDRYDAATGGAVQQWYRMAGAAPSTTLAYLDAVAVPVGATASQVTTTVGQTADPKEPLLRVGAASGTLTCSLDPHVPVSVGSEAVVQAEGGDRPVVVKSIQPATTEEPQARVVVAAKEGTLAKIDAATLLVTRSTSTGKVPVVPMAALRTTTGGGYTVTVLTGDQQKEIPVTVGRTSGGMAQVTAPDLHPGDRVRLETGPGGTLPDAATDPATPAPSSHNDAPDAPSPSGGQSAPSGTPTHP